MTTVKNTKGIIAGCLGVLLSTLLPFENSQADSIQANVAVVYGKSIPGFPGKIPDYNLTTKSTSIELRVFEGGGWFFPIDKFSPLLNNRATMSCKPYFWAIRWKTANPDIKIEVSKGLTDSGYSPLGDSVSGGTGYVSDYSCLVPAMKFGRKVRSTEANLVDIDITYQIWTNKYFTASTGVPSKSPTPKGHWVQNCITVQVPNPNYNPNTLHGGITNNQGVIVPQYQSQQQCSQQYVQP